MSSENIDPINPGDINSNLDKDIAKSRRPAALLAALGLIAIAAGAVGGLIYNVVVNDGSQSLTQLGTLATLCVGGLLALAGAKEKGD